jgi:hypothetical protein
MSSNAVPACNPKFCSAQGGDGALSFFRILFLEATTLGSKWPFVNLFTTASQFVALTSGSRRVQLWRADAFHRGAPRLLK